MISRSTVISELPHSQSARKRMTSEPISEKNPVKVQKVMSLDEVEKQIREKPSEAKHFAKSGGYPTRGVQQNIYLHLMSSSKRLIEASEK
jgi:hypothetical protein